MDENVKKIVYQWLEIDFYDTANKAGFISKKLIPDKQLIMKTIRCLDYITSQKEIEQRENYVITIIALMWTHIDVQKYDLRTVIVKFLSRIGYPTSAIIVDELFDREKCQFSSLNSILDQITTGFNQIGNEVKVHGWTYLLTSFQKRIWDAMETQHIIGVSAPTSAGKSFVILLKLM